MKLWGGRFEQGPSEVFERFSGSLHFDQRLFDADIRGSQAFARALEGVGILTAEIDWETGRFLVNYLIGEPEYRNKGVTNDITVPFRDYFFEKLGLKTIACTALSHNHPIIYYLLKTGWILDKTSKAHVKSNSDGTMLDLCFFSLSRDAWRAWKKQHPQGP